MHRRRSLRLALPADNPCDRSFERHGRAKTKPCQHFFATRQNGKSLDLGPKVVGKRQRPCDLVIGLHSAALRDSGRAREESEPPRVRIVKERSITRKMRRVP